MQTILLAHELDLAGWRAAARWLVTHNIAPCDVIWQIGQTNTDLFNMHAATELLEPTSTLRVPKDFITLAERLIMVREPARFALLYEIFWRLQHGERHLLKVSTDPAIYKAYRMSKAIGRDIHKMRAFVRFREVMQDGIPHFIAWFEPAHYIVEANADFFMKRFSNMRWSILTPDRCMHWDTQKLTYTIGADKSMAPDEDALEHYWLAYFSNIFNPARLKIGAMQSEMPQKYWHNLPEAKLIPTLIRDADKRTQAMIAAATSKTNKYDNFEVVDNKLRKVK